MMGTTNRVVTEGSVRRAGRAAVVALATLSLVTGCGGGGGETIVYRAGGSADRAEVEYAGADGVERATVDLPWSTTLDVGSEFDGKLLVTNTSAAGDVTCEFVPAGFRPVTATGEVSATCGGSFKLSGSSASGSFYTDAADREQPADAPVIASVALFGDAGEQEVFGTFETISLAVGLEQLTDEVAVSIDADVVPILGGDGGELHANSLLRQGQQYEGAEHTVVETIPRPGEGWAKGAYTAAVDVEIVDLTDTYEAVSLSRELDFSVESEEVGIEAYELADGRLSFRHPSDWLVVEQPSGQVSITTNTGLGTTEFTAGSGSLDDVVRLLPADRSVDALVVVYVERARFTAPGLEEWTELQLARLADHGLDVTERREVELAHGAATLVRGSWSDRVSTLVFTGSADRLYVVEYQAAVTVDESVSAAATAVLDSLVFDPDSEPPPWPLEEARSVSMTLTTAAGVALADVSVQLPAHWTVEDVVDEAGPQRFGFKTVGSDPLDAATPVTGSLLLETLDPAPSVADYADFYVRDAAERFADAGFKVIESSDATLDDAPAIAVTTSADLGLADELFAVVDGFGVQLRLTFPPDAFDLELLDEIVRTVEVVPRSP